MRIGFDNQKYLTMQSEHIRERISKFGDKLYLEFGGKLFDDFHASRVLPGFAPDSKLQMLLQLADQAEMIISINAADIENNKMRHDLGLTYDLDVLRAVWSLPNTRAKNPLKALKRSWRPWTLRYIIIILLRAILIMWSILSAMRAMVRMIM